MSRLCEYTDKLEQLAIRAEVEEAMEGALLDDRCKDIAPQLEGEPVEDILEIGIAVGIQFAWDRIMEAREMEEQLQREFGVNVLGYITYILQSRKKPTQI